MVLSSLKSVKYPTKKRVGRGPGSGKGKTSGRGHKGQLSRSGRSTYPTFEGGQTRLAQRVPKRKGFRNINKIEYAVVNVGDLSELAAGTVVDIQFLKDNSLIRQTEVTAKLLGRGKLEVALTIRLPMVSQKAEEKVNKAGGKIESVID